VARLYRRRPRAGPQRAQRRAIPSAFFAHDLDQARAVAAQLGAADAADPGQSSRLVGRCSAMLRRVLSWKITKAGTFCSRGQFGTQAAQGVEQRQVLRQHRQPGTLRCAAPLVLLAGSRRMLIWRRPVSTSRLASVRRRPPWPRAVHFQQAGGDQLAEHAAPGARIQVAPIA
jgi:hypothetical protein